MKKLFAFAITLSMILCMTGPQEAQAQRVDLAPNVGYGFDVFNQVGDPGSISIGPQLHVYFREAMKRDSVFVVRNAQGVALRDSVITVDRRRFSLIFNPGFDYYLFDINGMSGFQLDANLLLSLGQKTITVNNTAMTPITTRRSYVSPYVGLGLALSIVTGDEDPTVGDFCPSGVPSPCLLSEVESGTAIGLNLLGGVLWGKRSPRIITQFRYTLGSHELHRENEAPFDASSGLQFHGGLIFVISGN